MNERENLADDRGRGGDRRGDGGDRQAPVGDWLHEVCRLGDGAATCRYLTADPKGFACGKLDPKVASVIDAMIAEFNAKGDNCDGLEPEQIIPRKRRAA